jgi:hypothetical protein
LKLGGVLTPSRTTLLEPLEPFLFDEFVRAALSQEVKSISCTPIIFSCTPTVGDLSSRSSRRRRAFALEGNFLAGPELLAAKDPTSLDFRDKSFFATFSKFQTMKYNYNTYYMKS